MGELINLSDRLHATSPSREDQALFWARAAVAYEVIHERVPLVTAVKRFIKGEPHYGNDYQERIDVLLAERHPELETQATILDFEVKKGE